MLESKKSFIYVILFIIGIIYIFPFILTFLNSFMTQEEVLRNYSTEAGFFDENNTKYINMKLIPFKITLEQYSQVLTKTPIYLKMFVNSLKITIPVVFGQLVVSSMAAYAFNTLTFKFKQPLFFSYIIVMLLPLQVTLVPNYIMADILGISQSYLAIILPGIFNPFGVFLLYQYMKTIPIGYIESAKIDGANDMYIFLKIILPMIKSGIASLAMLTFIDYWNLVDQAIVFIKEIYNEPLSVFLSRINQEQMGVIFASSCFYAVPVLLILFYGQNYLKDGIQLSGLKG